ncbi:Transient receptor putative cation channel sub A member 1 [Desmophyllum pertusum]|uniref:Transient receptor putative cation channel sub A member 1 n=1 Tax=Desmophyllum pertusum TaxID=174260 RepID=A0A9W9ZV77_9CNID|nr:Transient receptor putative cation channel sub A member 1 [Desmophyllum pertusum]
MSFLNLLPRIRSTLCFWSLAKTFMMMMGEIDYGTIIVEAKDQSSQETRAPLAPIPGFSATIVCLFCMMVSVLLMNLLVGLAVGDIDSIQRNANMRRLAMQVEFATDIDQRYPRWLRRYFQRSVLVLKPNGKKPLAFLYRMNKMLFPTSDILKEGGNSDDVEEDERGKNNVSAEVAKQREQIKFLQKTVEDQSRLLQEISRQLKQAARPVDTAVNSGQVEIIL